jgi:hypothetical protein
MKSTDQANTKALFRHAFDVMKLLKTNLITPEEAKEHANLIKQSNNLLKYELDKAKAMQKYENIKINEIEETETGK